MVVEDISLINQVILSSWLADDFPIVVFLVIHSKDGRCEIVSFQLRLFKAVVFLRDSLIPIYCSCWWQKRITKSHLIESWNNRSDKCSFLIFHQPKRNKVCMSSWLLKFPERSSFVGLNVKCQGFNALAKCITRMSFRYLSKEHSKIHRWKIFSRLPCHSPQVRRESIGRDFVSEREMPGTVSGSPSRKEGIEKTVITTWKRERLEGRNHRMTHCFVMLMTIICEKFFPMVYKRKHQCWNNRINQHRVQPKILLCRIDHRLNIKPHNRNRERHISSIVLAANNWSSWMQLPIQNEVTTAIDQHQELYQKFVRDFF